MKWKCRKITVTEHWLLLFMNTSSQVEMLQYRECLEEGAFWQIYRNAFLFHRFIRLTDWLVTK
jgi:hypothetical protein